MTSGFYIYYCIAPDKAKEAQQAVQKIFDAIAAKTQVRGKLLCRMEDGSTWMEVYDAVPDATLFRTVLDDAVESAGLLEYLQEGTRRHLEHFVPLDAR